MSFLWNLGVEFPEPIFEFLFLCCTFAYLGSVSTLVSVMLLSRVLVQQVPWVSGSPRAITVFSDPATEELKLVLAALMMSGPGSGGDIS